MGTSDAIHTVSDCTYHPHESLRYCDLLTGQRVERRNNPAGLCLISARKIKFNTPVNPAKQNFRLELWTASIV
jgi:hypothetical protein